MTIGGKKTESVTIKGSSSGLLIRLRDDDDWRSIMNELNARLSQGQKFFRHANATLDLGRRELEAGPLSELEELLGRFEIQLDALISGTNATRSNARQLGLNIKMPDMWNTRPTPPPGSETDSAGQPFDSAEGLFVRRTLRSGQVLQHHADICLIGDVNPGAEIIAGGSIVVWGIVRGVVQAGALGDNPNATISALQLNASQLRIGTFVSRAPETEHGTIWPEIASVKNGAIIVQPWQPHAKR